MKICLINNLYKPYARGGAEKVLELIQEGLINQNHEVIIITTKPYFTNLNVKIKNYYQLNSCYYNLYKVPVFFRLFWHFYDMFDVITALKIKRILNHEKPDLIITNNLKGISYLTPYIIQKIGIRNIHILHDIQLIHPSGLMMHGQERALNSIFSKLYAKISSRLFSYPNLIISPSKWLLDLHLQRGFFKNINTVVIPNPANVSTDYVKATRKSSLFKFLYVGQIEKYKGVEFLVRIFKNIKNAHLEIIGSGKYLKNLEKEAKKYTNISITGLKTKAEVREAMLATDCLIVPSLCYENSPNVIYEAMAVGLPVLASRIGGITELLEENGGILFNPGDKVDLLSKIEWILKNPQKIEDLKNSYFQTINNYSLNNYLEKILSHKS